MTYIELNEFIKNYLENDNTGRAIMLNGKWGSGKSYYINNVLIPYLKRKECGKHKCAVVSLYGLNDISEISKSIYISLRTIKKLYKIKKKKEKNQKRKKVNKSNGSEVLASAGVAGKIIAKTIMNGIMSKVGFEIGQSNKDFKKVYKSINLNKKLVIFEDVERSGIDLIEFMGFVNNLTEQDGVKVLLVANENELTKTVNSENKKEYTPETKRYLEVKEKTIGDTINFQCNFEESIKSIYNNFPVDIFKDYSKTENINYILKNVLQKKDINFRLVIFACQKITNILNYIQKHNIDLNKDFKNCIVYSILAYTHSEEYKEKMYFDFQYFSQSFGTQDEPLPKFAYNYIINQTLKKEEIEECQQEFFKFKRFRRNNIKSPKEFSVIYEFETHTETEIKNALNEINIGLSGNQITSFYELGKLASYLIFIEYELKIKEAHECIQNLLNVFKGQKDINIEYLFVNAIKMKGDSQKAYQNLKDEIIKSINAVNLSKLDIKYTIEWIDTFFNSPEIYIKNWINTILNLDITKFSQIITEAHPKLIRDIRIVFHELYTNPRNYSTNEQYKIQALKEQLIQRQNEINDKIVKFHIENLTKELSAIQDRLFNNE